MKIDTSAKLKVHIKIMKNKLLKEGCHKMQLYPMFCLYYEKNRASYLLSKEEVLNMACEILVEND